MSDTVEKIYCCDKGDNDALVAAILANRRDDNPYAAMAAMNGGMGNWMNNPFAYIMFLALLRNGGFGLGEGYGAQNVELQAIRTQLQDNQNSSLIMDAVKGNNFALSQLAQNLNIDFNTLQKCCCDVQAAIQQVAGQVGFSAERVINAANLGNCSIIQAIKDCCCSTQKEILQLGSDIRQGQRDLGQAITQGFSQVAFQAQQDKCDIIRAGQDNTQRIIDTLNTHWKDEQAREIQDLKAELSQRNQTDAIIARLRYGSNGCGCGNNNGCGYGCGL